MECMNRGYGSVTGNYIIEVVKFKHFEIACFGFGVNFYACTSHQSLENYDFKITLNFLQPSKDNLAISIWYFDVLFVLILCHLLVRGFTLAELY